MPLGWPNPHQSRYGAYGTRPYGGGTGARLASSIATGVGAFIEGEDFTFAQLHAEPVLAHISFIPQPASSGQPIYIQAFPFYEVHCYIQASQESKPVPNGFLGDAPHQLITGYTPGDFYEKHVVTDESVAIDGYTPPDFYERHVAPDVTVSGYEGDIPRPGIRRLIKSLGVYMYGNAFGVFGVLGSQGAYIEVADYIDSTKHAYIKTPEFLSPAGKPAFISGHNSDRWTKHAYLFSAQQGVESTTAYVAGLAKERFNTLAYIHIATPATTSVGGYVHSATPLEVTKRTFVRGAGNVRSAPQFAWTTGLDRDWFTQHMFIQIETPRTVSKAAFIVGPPIVSNKPAYMFGMYIGISTKRAFIQIETPMFKGKPAFIRGKLPITAPIKRAYMDSHFAQRVGKPAFIQIITPRQEQKLAYISGPIPTTSLKRSYIEGINQERLTKRAFLSGHYVTPPSAIGAYIHIEEYVWKGQGAFIKVGEPMPTTKRAWINGLLQMAAWPRYCYIDSREKLADFQPAYVHIQTPIAAPKKMCFIQIQTPMPVSTKRAHIRNVGDLRQPHNCYTMGGYRVWESQLAYIHVYTPWKIAGPKCHIRNQPQISTSLGCYIFETGLNLLVKPCYIQAEYIGETSVTKPAFISGHSTVLSIESNHNDAGDAGIKPVMGCWINGVVRPLTKKQNAFIVSYGLIGQWDLDDGEFDQGNTKVDDTSTVDNDGVTYNFPAWVGGPHGDDC